MVALHLVTAQIRSSFSTVFALLIVSVTLSGCATTSSQIVSDDMVITPLQIATGFPVKSNSYKSQPDLKMVKTLVEGGADINKVNAFGSVLSGATTYGNYEMVSYLISKGANVNTKENLGDTPLMKAALMGKLDMVKLLVDKGADVNAMNTLTEWTPLTNAALQGQFATINYLIEKGASLSPHQAGIAYVTAADGMSLFMKNETNGNKMAKASLKKYEFIATLDLLKSKGADVNTINKAGENALFGAATNANPEILLFFLTQGVDPQVKSVLWGTPLEAAEKSKEENLKLLQSSKPPAGISDELFLNMKKIIKEKLPRYDKVISILKPLTNTTATKTVTTASSQESSTQGSTLGNQVVDTIADCAKLKASLYVCEKMPWPASTGCSILAKSQFSNSICRG